MRRSAPQHAGKHRDANEPAIVKALEKVGAEVVLLDQPCDLLVGFRGQNILLEVKNPEYRTKAGEEKKRKGRNQKERREAWRGEEIAVVWEEIEALRAIGFTDV